MSLAKEPDKLLACPSPYIKYTDVPPVIDGNVDAVWANAELGTLDFEVWPPVQPDFAGTQWRVLYDENYLYVLAEVKDERRINDSGTDWWEDDAVEIFIDGDNSQNGTYDRVNDFQFAFRYNDPVVNIGTYSVNNTTGIEFVQYEWIDGNGYTIEARIPWSTIGITPIPGNYIGFEIEIDDDEDGGGREAQMSAFTISREAWQNPSFFTPALFCANPKVTIEQAASQTDPTNTLPIIFDVVFSHDVTGFTFGDIDWSAGTATGITGTVTAINGSEYTVSITGASEGTLIATIPANLVQDNYGNSNLASTSTDNSVVYDNTKPNVVISSTESSPTNLLQIPITIEFSSEVFGFEQSDINTSNSTILGFNETVANLQWELLIEPITEGTIVVQVPANIATDDAGNGNNASNNFSFLYEVENRAPLIENQSFTIDERSEAGTLVGQVVASDPDNDALTFSILSGNDGGAFTIDAETGDITVNNTNAVNYFTNPVFTLLVNVDDDQVEALSAQADVTINLNEVISFEANNIFVPNSQTNQYWKIKEVGRYTDYELTIRSSEGRIVFQTTNYKNDWKGTYNSKPLPTGTYYYFLQNGANLFKGFINIIYK